MSHMRARSRTRFAIPIGDALSEVEGAMVKRCVYARKEVKTLFCNRSPGTGVRCCVVVKEQTNWWAGGQYCLN